MSSADLDDLGQGAYTPEGIDIPDFLREALLLAVTTHPTCLETAACDVRTQALLDSANRPFQEAEAAPDPRWAALKALMSTESEE